MLLFDEHNLFIEHVTSSFDLRIPCLVAQFCTPSGPQARDAHPQCFERAYARMRLLCHLIGYP